MRVCECMVLSDALLWEKYVFLQKGTEWFWRMVRL